MTVVKPKHVAAF